MRAAVRRLGTWTRRGTAPLAARAVRHMSGADAAKSSRLSKFHTLDIPGRVSTLEKAGFLTPETSAALRGQGLALDDANNMIENVLATFGVPMVSRKDAAGGVASPVMCARLATDACTHARTRTRENALIAGQDALVVGIKFGAC